MLTKDTRIDRIEVMLDGVLQVRHATVILEDGVPITDPIYRRETYRPGDDVTTVNARIKKVADAVWTPDVIDAERTRTQRGLRA